MGVSRRRCEECGCMRKKAHEKKALKDDNDCQVYSQKDNPKTYPWKNWYRNDIKADAIRNKFIPSKIPVMPVVSNPIQAEKKSGKKQGFFSKLFRRKTV